MSAVCERVVKLRCGESALLGIIHIPAARQASVGVVVVVGGPQYRVGSHRQFVLMARAIAQAGYPVFRFDYRGMGDSDGAPRTFECVEEDIRVAADVFLAEQPELSGVVLWGLCDAASALLMYCNFDRRVKGLILANPWVRTTSGEARARMRYYYFQRFMQRSFWRKVVSGGFNPARSARDLVATAGSATRFAAGASPRVSFIERMHKGLTVFRSPVLILISEHDLTAREFVDLCAVSPSWSAAVSAAHVDLATIKGADHTFSTRAALEHATQTCLAWLSRFRQSV